MKALFIHDHKFPKNEDYYYYSYGFDEEFFNRYLDIFDDFGVVARENETDDKNNNQSQPVEKKVEFLTVKNYKQLKRTEIRKQINNKIQKYDCLIIRLPSILGLYALEIALKNKKPVIIELVGCPWDAFWYQNLSKKLIAPFMTFLTKRALRKTKYAVYVTEEFLQNRYPTNGQSISCSNVTLHSVEEEYLYNRVQKISSLNEKKILGTCATLDASYKGQKYVIEAISKLKSEGHCLEYQLVGGGDDSELKNHAKIYNVENEVKFIGQLKHEEVFDWLDTIDIYIQPSETEGLPRAVIEAMSKACPVIGSDAGGIPELIDQDFVFAKKNVEDICEKIKKYNNTTMKEQALINHSTSKNYVKELLYRRRKKFFNNFLEIEIIHKEGEF